jgi:hypothetical protein
LIKFIQLIFPNQHKKSSMQQYYIYVIPSAGKVPGQDRLKRLFDTPQDSDQTHLN